MNDPFMSAVIDLSDIRRADCNFSGWTIRERPVRVNARVCLCYDWRPMAVVDSRGKRVITEEDLRAAGCGGTLRMDVSALLTPLATDFAKERGVRIERVSKSIASNRYRIDIATYQGGFDIKEDIKHVHAILVQD